MQVDVYFQANLFTDLQTPVIVGVNGDETPRYRDVEFLLNEKRLQNLDPTSLKKYLEPLTTPSASDAPSLSDDDLFQLCNSRYIQQPSDVSDFAKFLTDKADEIKSEYKKIADRKKAWDDYVNEMKNISNKIMSTDDTK